MLLLKLPPPSPRISVVSIGARRPSEPIPRFLDLPLCPKQPRDRDDDGGRVVGLLEGVDGAGLSGWAGLEEDGVGVEKTGSRESLDACQTRGVRKGRRRRGQRWEERRKYKGNDDDGPGEKGGWRKGRRGGRERGKKRRTSRQHRLRRSTPIPLLNLHTLKPQLLTLPIDIPRLLQQGPRLNPHPSVLLQPRRHDPQRDGGRAATHTESERFAGGG